MNGTEGEVAKQALWTGPFILRCLEVLVLAVTAGIVFKYTKETQRLRKSAETQIEKAQEQTKLIYTQNDLSIRPYVVIWLDSDYKIKIKNIGNDSALNIHFDEIEAPGGEKIVALEHITILEKGDMINVPFIHKEEYEDLVSGEKEMENVHIVDFFMDVLYYRDVEENFNSNGVFSEINIIYQDVMLQTRNTKSIINANGISIIEIS